MPPDKAPDVADLLHRRAEFIDALSSGAAEREEVASRVGVSDSTAYRALRELRGYDLVEEGRRGLCLTRTGELLRDCYEGFLDGVEALLELRDLASAVPRDAELSVDLFRRGDAVYPDPHDPFRPVSELKDTVIDASRVRGFTPVLHPAHEEVLRERAERGRETDALLSREAAEGLADRSPDVLRAAGESDAVTLRVVDGSLPYGLVVAENPEPVAVVVVYGSPGEVSGMLRNDDPEAVRWAEEVYRDYRDLSRPLDA